MTTISYVSNRTGLIFVDLYNDFLSAGGKLWPLVEGFDPSLNTMASALVMILSRRHAVT